MAIGAMWDGKGYVQVEVCCEIFADATKGGTDNEGYGRLIHKADSGKWKTGQALPDIGHCPWCGKQI